MILFTGSTLRKSRNAFFTALSFIALSLIFASCSSSGDNDIMTSEDADDGNRTMVFRRDGAEWKVELSNNNIDAIYVDGKKLPENEIAQHKGFIQNKIKEFDKEMEEFQAKMKDFDLDMDEFNESMSELREELNNRSFEFSFDSKEFNDDMRRAASEIRLAFESDDFKENMRQLQEELKDINVNVDINMDDVHKEIQLAQKEIENIHVNIDMSDLKVEMENLKEQLKDLNIDVKSSNKSLKKFSRFMDDFRDELEADGIIENSEEDFSMDFNSEELIINGNKVPAELHEKYKRMFEEHLGKKMDKDMNIKLNE